MKFREEIRGFYIKNQAKVMAMSIMLAMLVVISTRVFSIADAEYTSANSDIESTSVDDTSEDSIINESIIVDDAINTSSTSIDTPTTESLDESTSIDDNIEEGEASIVIEDKKEYNQYFTGYTDLGAGMSGVTAEMLDEATAYYSKYQSFENKFIGKGYIFIEAQEKSGIDAVWLYAMAVFESGWGTSEIALERGNYFGIGAWDTDMDRSAYMADSLHDGIVNGACWIAEHYYNNDQTNMVLMNSVEHHSYAPGNEVWIPTIEQFINSFYKNWRTL